MKMNFNKDLLLKHKFWVVLVFALPAVLAALFILLVPVADAIATQRKKLEADVIAAEKALNGVFVNQPEIDKINKLAADTASKQNDVWARVYGEQADGIFWPKRFEETYDFKNGKFLRELKYLDGGGTPPPDDEHHFSGKIVQKDNKFITVKNKEGKSEKFYRVNSLDMRIDKDPVFFSIQLNQDATITYQTGRYFNDRLHDTEQSNYSNWYRDQIRPILDIVEPVTEEGEGVVQLKDWLVPRKSTELPHERGREQVKFIRYVPEWVVNVDISEEAWLAQEDLWIQREIYRCIRTANDYVAEMQMLGKPAKGKDPAVFQNAYFEIKLELIGDSKLRATVKNIRNNRQKLEVNFKVRFNEDKNIAEEKIHIEGEPLDPPGTKDKTGRPTDVLVKEIELGAGPPRTGIYGARQILTWETAAVRRIDHIAIGSMTMEDIAVNHRIFPEGTRPLVPEKKDEANPGDVKQGFPGEGRFPPGGGFGPGAGDPDRTVPNKLVKNRYIEVTDQSRRIPVAVSMIVDQDHMDRVLTAFDNSKFRFVLNQVLINRYPGSLRPNLPNRDDPQNPNPAFRPGGGGGEVVREGGRQPFFPPPGAAGMPGQTGGDDEAEANIELVLYGTMTLYQRYPPRKIPATWDEAAKQ